jgi:maleate cis-trans isomerase
MAENLEAIKMSNASKEFKKNTDNSSKDLIFLLCSIGIYERGITWYRLEKQFIRWNLRAATISKADAYKVIESLNLIDKEEPSFDAPLPNMTINSQGEDYLKSQGINIVEIRNRVSSMEEVILEIHLLEEMIYGQGES